MVAFISSKFPTPDWIQLEIRLSLWFQPHWNTGTQPAIFEEKLSVIVDGKDREKCDSK